MGCGGTKGKGTASSSSQPPGDSDPPKKKMSTSGKPLNFFATSRSPLALTDEVFTKYDADGNGSLSVKELRALITDAFPGQTCTEDDISELHAACDLDSDGMIGINELRAFLRCYVPGAQTIKTRSALIVIDVQNDFITGSLANQYNAVEIVPTINSMRDAFDIVVISYDWHPEEHCSFVESANAGKIALVGDQKTFEPFSMVTLKGDADREQHDQMLYPRHAVQNTEGGKCHADLVIKEKDKAVYKGTKANIDSYSAFYDNCKANDVGLLKLLQEEGITDVFCCGLVFDICVKSTALHGAELGFKVAVVEDASKPLLQDNVDPTRAQLKEAGVVLVSTAEAIKSASAQKECSLAEHLRAVRESSNAKKVHAGVSLASHSGICKPC